MEMSDWNEQRNVALTNLDVAWARDYMPGASSDEVRLIAMHKARYECTGLTDDLRHASREWLQQRGYNRLHGAFLPDGELPE